MSGKTADCHMMFRMIRNLNDNELTDLPRDIFRNNTHLEIILLDNNKLQDLPQDIFSAHANLKALFLGNNLLKTLPENIFRITTQLEVADYDILVQMQQTIENLSLFLDSFLEGNQLKDLPQDVFNANTKLVWLMNAKIPAPSTCDPQLAG
ncbi:Carboxypeptidase N subunit 2 [Stylophora pistillata]|uniref:Carboxypeptidase N subunit 2 n=1 Tax=Stylophora pistillata TaxID=50429 RepID=A0A2B4RCX2_STYPI|nr:Carboxypeptidase N subunit 2 [Stylophora pistillata]